ncbi:MAG: SWIM zinc finger family protein [Pirellulaceae bacterium]
MGRYGGGRYGNGYGYGGWAPYVPVAQRRRQAEKKMDALRKKGVNIQPVTIDGRTIARSFWGEAWCEHLESFSDFENRLPRGRSYVRNGSVCHMAVAKGKIEAKVAGSELYTVEVSIKTLPRQKWTALKRRCSGQIGSLLELLQGKLSDHVMEVVTDPKEGMFPLPGEMSFACSCPDWANMCKHVAAVLYGIGARLDTKPELLFTLRGVNHEELIDANAEQAVAAATSGGKSKRLAADEIDAVFGIELDTDNENMDAASRTAPSGKRQGKTVPKSVRAKQVSGQSVGKKTAKTSRKVKQVSAVKTVKKAATIKSVKKSAAVKSVKKSAVNKKIVKAVRRKKKL